LFFQINQLQEIPMASFHISIKSGKRGNAAEHAAYIARVGKHTKKGERSDLVAVEHGNLPVWANDSTQEFWKAADRYERLNGATYRELEVALPNELTNDQNLALVKDFVRGEIGDKPFQYAIHMPNASLGNVDQPHAHIMLSDRMPDGIQRTPEQHFRRFNGKDPEKGGCKKDSGGKDKTTLKTEVVRLREHWADLQNEHLEKNGHQARVDHRSNKDRGISAVPERHLGQAGVRTLTDEEKEGYRENRDSKQKQS
jgi:hypothetical protein